MEKICYIFLFQRFYLYYVCILQILSDVEDLYFKDVGINLIYNLVYEYNFWKMGFVCVKLYLFRIFSNKLF